MKVPQQIAWEKECVDRGTARYYANQDRLRDSGTADQTDVVSYLLRDRLVEVGAALEALSKMRVGNGGAYNRLLASAAIDGDFMKIAYIGAKTAFQVLMTKKENTILKVCLGIASRLEADLKCQLFEATHPAYYATVTQSLEEQKVQDYVHKHKVLMKKFNDFDLKWNDWTVVQKVHIGSRVLRCLLAVFDDVLFINKLWSRGKSTSILDTTPNFDIWAAEFEKERGFMFPIYLPLKIPARAWEDNKVGGYYTPQMSSRMPFIKTKGKAHRDFVESYQPPHHHKAVNKLQRTSWVVNTQVLDVQSEIYEKGLGIGIPSNVAIKPLDFPEHLTDVPKETLTDDQKEEISDWKALAKRAYGREQQRKGQVLAFMQSHKLAKELRDWKEIYFAYNCDFRGRIYCATAGLSPQGNDSAKGMLKFSKGIALGKRGVHWLAIHGANTFGIDKVSYEGRVAWTTAQEENIRKVVKDPIGARAYWGGADKPYQFLAFCFEWAGCDYGRDTNYLSSIPIGLDGSCNGLQHFSALLRDAVGAKATNLSECSKPEDIYKEVADVTTRKLQEVEDDPRAAKWLAVGITRQCAKRPVMTLPYGATQQSARQYILEYTQENWEAFKLDEKHQWEFAKYLTPFLWEAIGEVVLAAREGMSWLQKNVGKDYASWLSPIGFPIFQYYKKVEALDIRTQLNGRLTLKVRDADQDGIANSYSQRNGIAPNFIHSIDSTHMVMTINITDLHSYAMIHDDYGTHAANTDILFKAIRSSFKALYTQHDPLLEWAEQMGVETDTMPTKGTYNINNITRADYFFG